MAAKDNNFLKIDPTSAVVFLILIIIGEAFLGYMYLLKPKNDILIQETERIENLRYREMIMRAEYESIPDLKVKIESNNNVIKNKAQKLPGYIAQEEMLLTINNFILGSGIKIANIGLTNMEDANLSDIIKKSGISDPAIIEADKYNIFSSSMNLSYEGTYDQLYSFIKSVENNERYIFVSNISIDRQNATQVSGNMSVSFVGVGGIGINDEYNLEVPEIKDPKNNIFEPYEGYVEAFNPTGEIIKASPIPFSQADFSIVINSYLDNAGKVIMKTANNPDSDLVYNKNSYVTGSFSVSGTDGSYKYAYSIGENYSTGTIVLPENRTDKINLIVVSSERRDSFDKVGFSLSITSGADVPVYIYVVNEDDTLPRFKVGRMSGNVYVR